MARPKGTKYIKTPDIMWELFQKYKHQTKSKPIRKMVFVGRDGQRDYEERERPLTMEGFENFVADEGLNEAGLANYFANTNGNYEDYLTICSRIRRAIKQDQIEGGMASIYNASITQRLNGLTEKTENKNEDNIKISFED